MEKIIITEFDSEEICCLEKRMLDFYQTTKQYEAFAETNVSDHTGQWQEIVNYCQTHWQAVECVRILEIGAGRSGFGKFIRSQGLTNVHLTFHDVTQTNVEFLKQWADDMIIGPTDSIRPNEKFHVVFHSYVLEHVVRPVAFLKKADELLIQGGLHCIECPKYDFPIYISNSLCHLSIWKKFVIKLWDIVRHQPFSIIKDPAIFHLPFSIDRDAVHVVSEHDLRHYYKAHAKMKTWHARSFGFRHWMLNNYLTCRLMIIKS